MTLDGFFFFDCFTAIYLDADVVVVFINDSIDGSASSYCKYGE